MDMPAEELTDAEIENLFAKGVVKGDTKRFLWHVGTAVVIGFSGGCFIGPIWTTCARFCPPW